VNIGREIRTVRILEEPEAAPEPVEEPGWPAKPREEPAPVPN
jgi:hypothetical protein